MLNDVATGLPFEAALLDPLNFQPAREIDQLVPLKFGLYAIRVRDVDLLPEPFQTHALSRSSDLIYIGEAVRSTLRRRFLENELRAKGNGTFFRSLGAVLGFRPEQGSLFGKVRQQNYRFVAADTARIIEWINTNLLVSWVVFDQAIHDTEVALIARHRPLFNLRDNPAALPELAGLRAACRAVAVQARVPAP